MDVNIFLSVDYGKIGFLINKNQFHSSCYLEDKIPIDSPVPHADHIIRYGEKNILVFNLHQALQELFYVRDTSKARLLLIIHIDTLSGPVKKAFTRVHGEEEEITRNLIGLQIKSDARMESLRIEQLRLPPISLRTFLKRYGIVACFFPTSERIQYLIEVDSICSRCIT